MFTEQGVFSARKNSGEKAAEGRGGTKEATPDQDWHSWFCCLLVSPLIPPRTLNKLF